MTCRYDELEAEATQAERKRCVSVLVRMARESHKKAAALLEMAYQWPNGDKHVVSLYLAAAASNKYARKQLMDAAREIMPKETT